MPTGRDCSDQFHCRDRMSTRCWDMRRILRFFCICHVVVIVLLRSVGCEEKTKVSFGSPSA